MDLETRLIKHKCDAKQRPHLSKFFTFMNEQGIDDFIIDIVEEYPCETKEQREKREGEITREMGTLNQRIAGRTRKEYKQEFAEYLKVFARENKKKWRAENREHYLEKEKGYKKTYREKHKEQLQEKASTKVECECGGHYTLSQKAEHMQSKKHLKYLGTFDEEEYKNSKRAEQIKSLYEKQKGNLDEEKMKEYKKNHYEKNKEELSKQSKQRILCECGMEVCQGAYTRHLKSKHHQNYLNNNIKNYDEIPQEECQNGSKSPSS